GVEHAACPPYAAPARATDLSGLPPALIEVGSAETFRDEDMGYATRICQAGGVAELHVWPGGYHGFTLMVAGGPVVRRRRGACQLAARPAGRLRRRPDQLLSSISRTAPPSRSPTTRRIRSAVPGT